MRIYVDQTLFHPYSQREECQDECRECKTPVLFSPEEKILPSVLEDQQHIQFKRLQHAPGLYKQQVSMENWLLCNPTASGHVLVLDTQALLLFERFHRPSLISDMFVQNQSESELIQMLNLFLKTGLLVDVEEAPQTYTQDTPGVLSAWIHVTNSCNLSCSYCYIDKSQENMSLDTTFKSINAIFRSAVKHQFTHVQLKYAGGEASLHLPQVIEMHDYALQLAQKHHIVLNACIFSNGVYLSLGALENLKKRNIGIMLSLDGIGTYQDQQRSFKNGFGSFRYIDRTIQKLLQHTLIPTISITVSQRNLAGLPELITYILDRNLPFHINFYRENEYSAHLEDLSFTDQQMIQGMQNVFAMLEQRLPRHRLLESVLDKANFMKPHQHTCSVGQNYLVIDQRGGITKCQTTMQQTITTIDADDPLQLVRDDLSGIRNLPVEEKEGCQKCHWRHWCTGGCPALTYRITGRYDIKSPNCNIYQALFPAALDLEAKRLLMYELPISFENVSERRGTSADNKPVSDTSENVKM